MTDLILPTYSNTTVKETDMSVDLDDLLDRANVKPAEAEEIPEPGTPENPWFGVDRVVSGELQFHAFSGSERRRIRRANERHEAGQQRKGERLYNRQQRKQAFDAGTVRAQMAILKGDVEVTPAMRANLEGHIVREHRINERKLAEPDRKATAAARREARLFERRHARIDAGVGRHADLVALGLR